MIKSDISLPMLPNHAPTNQQSSQMTMSKNHSKATSDILEYYYSGGLKKEARDIKKAQSAVMPHHSQNGRNLGKNGGGLISQVVAS